MLGFKQIELSDKDILNRFFAYNQRQNSECTFTNLYMWRRCYAVRWAVVEGHLIIEPNAFESSWVLPPYGLNDDDDAFRAALQHLADACHQNNKPFVIRAVTEEERTRIERVMPGRFHFIEEPDIEDYIYEGESLRTLGGRKFSKKRNHINGFKKNHPEYTLEALSKDNIEEAHDFLERWCGERNCSNQLDDGLLCEREAIHDALYAFDDLDFIGALVRIDGNVCALTMGEKINDNTAVIHVEKAFQEYNGLYQVINQDFLKAFFPDVAYVNREEDMGLEGLRKAKESYFPAYLLTKYKAVMTHD